MRESLKVNDLILSTATSTTSGINLYDLPGTFAPAADFDLSRRAWEQAKKAGLALHTGTTLCNDHFYVEDKPAYSRKWEKWGILASEQEGAGLYSVAAREGVKALMLLTVVANLYHPEEDVLTAQERERGLDRMILLGLDTLVSE